MYGSVLLLLPFNNGLNYFYLFYFPIIVNLIFVIVIFSHFNLKNFKELLLCFVFIFNPSTLLIMERLNFDILIFLIIIILCYLRSNILNFFFITFLTLAKFYPIVISSLFFLGKKQKNLRISYIFFTIFIICVGYFLYLDKNNIIKIFDNRLQFSANYYWSFYFLSLNKIIVLRNIFSEKTLLFFSLFLCFIFIFYGFSFIKKYFNQGLYDFNYNNSLFLISGTVLVSTYFTFNNWTYREIFIFGLIPFILFHSLNNNSFKFLLNFIIFRFVFFSISSYYSIFHSNDYLLILQKTLDICFISFITGILLFLYLKIFISCLPKKSITMI